MQFEIHDHNSTSKPDWMPSAELQSYVKIERVARRVPPGWYTDGDNHRVEYVSEWYPALDPPKVKVPVYKRDVVAKRWVSNLSTDDIRSIVAAGHNILIYMANDAYEGRNLPVIEIDVDLL